MKEIKTAHGFKVIENVGVDRFQRTLYRYYISSPTHFNHSGGVIVALSKMRGGCKFEVIDTNAQDIELFKTKRECIDWLLNRIDRALLNETPYGGYCPDIPY